MAKTSFNEFLLAVAPEHRVFVEKLNDKLLEQGCELVIKEVKSGYTATYQLEKKTVMNWVFRKTVSGHAFTEIMPAGMRRSLPLCLPTCKRKWRLPMIARDLLTLMHAVIHA